MAGVRGPLRVPATLVNRGWTPPLPIRAWLVEHPDGLLLVDTGENARASEHFPRWHPYYRRCIREQVTPDDEIGPQLRALGVEPGDIRWVVLTHLHTDHAGGLGFFPRSQIVVSRTEWKNATGLRGRLNGYVNRDWPSWLSPLLVEPDHTIVDGIELIATPGHTPGHMSVLVAGRHLIAGDASYTLQLLLDDVVDGVAGDARTYRRTLERLRGMVAGGAIYLPTHDPEAVNRLQA
jgi:N-acyl homoserine lactone hydrolase